jgi:hypothetical protein
MYIRLQSILFYLNGGQSSYHLFKKKTTTIEVTASQNGRESELRTDVHDQSRQPTRKRRPGLVNQPPPGPRRFHSTSTNITAALASQPSAPAAVPRSRCLFRRVPSSTHARLLKKLQSDCLLLHSQGGCLPQATTRS